LDLGFRILKVSSIGVAAVVIALFTLAALAGLERFAAPWA